MISLRNRALIGGVISACISVVIGSVALFSYVENLALRRFDEALLDRHIQVVVALENSSSDPDLLTSGLPDPAFNLPYSGRYWQIESSDGAVLASRSLFDSLLDLPRIDREGISDWEVGGPDGGTVRGVSQFITLDDQTEWTVSVGESITDLTAEQSQLRRSLLLAFALVGTIGILAAIIQTSAILRPLHKLRHDVAHRWDRGIALVPEEYPDEVSPMVTDINDLMDRNRKIIDGARRQAADLAHALKTPSAILRNELAALAEKHRDIQPSIDALNRIDAQLGRSLARMRAANSGESAGYQTDVSNSINRLSRVFCAMAERQDKEFESEAEENLLAKMDVQDIEEVLGNLLDNALKWCARRVRISARKTADGVEILVEDDGPGIPEDDQREALRSGGRLDASSPGTGLGLAITVDLLRAYGANLLLGRSKTLGGLEATVSIPA